MNSRSNSDQSDGEDSNIFTYQEEAQTQIVVKGPNISNFNISKLPISNNGRPRYAESLYNQHSYHRDQRDTSPMSVYSTSSVRHQTLQHSAYGGAMSSQRSMYNGRRGFCASVRSFDSNVSAIDIAQALKSHNFNKYDNRILDDAINRYLKKRNRRKIEKKRNKRFFSKGCRRRSGYDSGEQASESSMSDDDDRSVRTCRAALPDSSPSSKSTRTDYTDFRKTMQESNMYKDCTDYLRQHSFRSLISSAPKYDNKHVTCHKSTAVSHITQHYPAVSQKDRFRSGFLLPSQKSNVCIASSSIPENPHRQNIDEHGSNERNKAKNPARNNQYEENRHRQTINEHSSERNNIKNLARNNQYESASENEEIFSSNTIVGENVSRYNNDFQSKRRFNYGDYDNKSLPQIKRNKFSSPQKRAGTIKRPQKQNSQKTDKKTCDFVFAKPQLPLTKPVVIKNSSNRKQSMEKSEKNKESSQPPRKAVSESVPLNSLFSFRKPTTKTSNVAVKLVSKSNPTPQMIPEAQPAEQLIAKSSQPLDDVEGPKQTLKKLPNNLSQEKESESTQFSTTDVSMRPSFIKRKLFTQKADIGDNKNTSLDTTEKNSPQSNMYSMMQKERNLTRKLVTSKSCLNRDLGDESNLLELIHKIVPADQMNLTSATNRTDIRSNKSKSENNTGNKWDVTSAITQCNIDEESETYTDEEIFKSNDSVIKSKTSNTRRVGTQKEKLPQQIANKLNPSPNTIHKINSPVKNSDAHKSSGVLNCVKSFWDTDGESDAGNEKTPEKTNKGTARNNKTWQSVSTRDVKSESINCEKYMSASNSSKLKKSSDDQIVYKISPPSKQEKNTNKRNFATSKKPPNTNEKKNHKSVSKSTSTDIKQAKNIQKVKTNLTSIENVQALNNEKATHNNSETIFTCAKDLHQKVINQIVRVNLRRSPKVNKCCDVPPNNKSANDCMKPMTKCLRSREIDLSTTASSGLDTPLKDRPKQRGRPCKTKTVTEMVGNKENISNISDLSFNLAKDKTIVSRQINGGLNDIRNRPSDVSFSLLADAKKLNKPTTRSSERSRNASKLNDEVTNTNTPIMSKRKR